MLSGDELVQREQAHPFQQAALPPAVVCDAASLRHRERMLQIRQFAGELDLEKLGFQIRKRAIRVKIGELLYREWLDRACPGHGDFVSGMLEETGLTSSSVYRYLHLYFEESGILPPSFSVDKDATRKPEGPASADPPTNIFVPVAAITEQGIEHLHKKRQEAANFPDPPTRVQLAGCATEALPDKPWWRVTLIAFLRPQLFKHGNRAEEEEKRRRFLAQLKEWKAR